MLGLFSSHLQLMAIVIISGIIAGFGGPLASEWKSELALL
jgi:hypothetical protein